MAEHDRRFKTLLRACFPDFLRLAVPERATNLDTGVVEWLDKEVFPDPLRGEALRLDLVARLRLRDGGDTPLVALVHIEVESRDAVAQFRPRMYEYYHLLRRRYPDAPILPIALYLHVGLDGHGMDTYTETFDGVEVLTFRWYYLWLPALDAEAQLAGDNELGVALSPLMRLPRDRQAFLRAEGLRRLVQYPDPAKRFLLVEAFDAYAGLDEDQRPVYEELLKRDEYQEVRPMHLQKSYYERGVDAGRELGREEGTLLGRRASVRDLLEAKFGPLPDDVRQKTEALTEQEIQALWRTIFAAKTLDELGLR